MTRETRVCPKCKGTMIADVTDWMGGRLTIWKCTDPSCGHTESDDYREEPPKVTL